jgi:hypothetical protein
VGVPALYSALVTLVLFVHAFFLVWIVFGAFVARSRPLLRGLHVVSLIWGVFTEVLPWPCPLTLAENWLEQRAGIEPYQGGFLLHYLDKFVYPDLPASVLTSAGVIVCLLNLAFYGWLMWKRGVSSARTGAPTYKISSNDGSARGRIVRPSERRLL